MLPYLSAYGFQPRETCSVKRAALKGREDLIPEVAFIESEPMSFQECAKLVLECHPAVMLSNFLSTAPSGRCGVIEPVPRVETLG